MKKVLVLSVIWIMVMFASILPVNASESEEVILTLSSSQINPGDTFYLSISQTSSQGIIGLEGTLQYDENALELVKTEMKQSWADYGENALISAISNDPIISGEVCIVTFKAKDKISTNQVSIELTNTKVYRDYADYSEIAVEAAEATIIGQNSQDELVSNKNIDANFIVGIIMIIAIVFVLVICIVVKVKNNPENDEKE